jgi:hypothetical protein
MRPTTRLAWGLLCATVALGGCQRLNIERKVSLNGVEPYQLDVDAPQYEQKLTVEVDAPGTPVLAYVVKADDAEAASKALLQEKEPANVLASTKEKSEKVSLPATIPAKTGYSVLLRSVGAKGDVTLRIKGQ